MSLHGYLSRHLPPRAAAIVCAALYAVLIGAIILLVPMAPARFDYGRY